MTGGTPTDEPFLVLCFDAESAAASGMGVAVFALDGSASATISITGEVIQKLDNKFLPKMTVNFSRMFFDLTDVHMKADKSVERIVAAIHDGMIVEGRYIENGTLFIFHVAKAPVSVESVENLDEDCLVFSSVYGGTPTLIRYKRLASAGEVFEIDPVTP